MINNHLLKPPFGRIFLELFPKHRTSKSKMKLFFGLDVEVEHAKKNAGKLWKCSRERIF